MTTSQRTPREEVNKRLAEAGLSLKIAGQAVGLQDHQRMLASHAKRVDQANAMGARVLGMEDAVSQSGDDDMGNIIVTGDINLAPGADTSSLPWMKGAAQTQPTTPSAPSNAAPAPQDATAEPASGLPGWVKSAAVLGATALGGAGVVPIAGAAIDWMYPDAPAVVQPVEQPTPALPPSLDHGGVTIEPFQVNE